MNFIFSSKDVLETLQISLLVYLALRGSVHLFLIYICL